MIKPLITWIKEEPFQAIGIIFMMLAFLWLCILPIVFIFQYPMAGFTEILFGDVLKKFMPELRGIPVAEVNSILAGEIWQSYVFPYTVVSSLGEGFEEILELFQERFVKSVIFFTIGVLPLLTVFKIGHWVMYHGKREAERDQERMEQYRRDIRSGRVRIDSPLDDR